ncbi:MAG TPA: histidine kinase [Chitinophagales bacterium]|nr:histidine kinase [Chitinophagales bacterium]
MLAAKLKKWLPLIAVGALTLLASALIVAFALPSFDKYSADLLEEIDSKDKFYWYYDFDGDGYSEEIEIQILEADLNPTRVLVYDKGKVIDQWNFPYPKHSYSALAFGDHNGNGFTEVFLFTSRADSLFINWFEPFNKPSPSHSRFITCFALKNGKAELRIDPIHFKDNTGSGRLYFITASGFSLYPRKLFVFDVKNDSVFSSPESGAMINGYETDDLNNDGLPEILVNAQSVGNYPEDSLVPYHDKYCWLMAFNLQAQFLFEPVRVGEYSSILRVAPFRIGDDMRIAAFYNYESHMQDCMMMQLYSATGELVKSDTLKPYDRYNRRKFESVNLLTLSHKNRDQLFLVYGNGEIEEFDSNLVIIKQYKVPGVMGGLLKNGETVLDADGNGEKEIVFRGSNKFIITRSDFSEPVSIHLFEEEPIGPCTVIQKGAEQPKLFIVGENTSYIYHYSKNPYYYLKYPAWGGVLLSMSLLAWLLGYIQRQRARQRYEAEKKLAEFQLKSARTQLDSHFSLNILNSIGTLYYKQETDKANYVFGKYAKLLRSSLLSADQIFLPLEKELEEVDTYLALEKFRLHDAFDYEIKTDAGMDGTLQVPKMLVHTFAENAVKHGLRHLKSGGRLHITVSRNDGQFVIRVRDNGIGREKAKEYASQSTGRGMKILDEMLQLYFSLTKSKIAYTVSDLRHPDGTAAGTEAVIFIHLG